MLLEAKSVRVRAISIKNSGNPSQFHPNLMLSEAKIHAHAGKIHAIGGKIRASSCDFHQELRQSESISIKIEAIQVEIRAI